MRSSVTSLALPLTISAILVITAGRSVWADDIEKDVLDRLDRLRAIYVTSDDDSLANFNKQLDESWTFFNENKETVLPILAKQLSSERAKDEPNDFLLLDVGNFLLLEGREDKQYTDEAKEALFSLNPQSAIIQANFRQLFEFTHGVAADRDPRILSFIDKVFLYDPDCWVFIPQHSLQLDATLICVFLYGVYGRDSEAHLNMLLDDQTVVNRVIEILTWMGSPASLEQVKNATTARSDYETFTRVLGYMMRTAGPAGKEMVLGFDPAVLDSVSQEYFAQVIEAVKVVTYDALKSEFEGIPGDAELPDEQVKKRLSVMYENYGKDDSTNPAALLNSSLPKEYLIEQLESIRFRMFHRLSDEALSDVQMTNILINTLRYREK